MVLSQMTMMNSTATPSTHGMDTKYHLTNKN